MLTLCPTTIGNLDDLSARQRDCLQHADLIACEDTRHTGKLLELLQLTRAPHQHLISYHEHNAAQRVPELIQAMKQGKSVALVSDAGTPTISDPGYKLVSACSSQDIPVTALPGPVAGIVALSASGLPTDRFFFEGFLPAKTLARTQRLEVLHALGTTVILYESPHRALKTLADIIKVFGPGHPLCIGRELTKKHEEYIRSGAQDALNTLSEREKLRGEFVIILAPVDASQLNESLQGDALNARIIELLDAGMRTKAVRDALAPSCALPSSQLYEHIEKLKKTR